VDEALQLAALNQLEEQVESRVVLRVCEHAANEGRVHFAQQLLFGFQALLLPHLPHALAIQHLVVGGWGWGWGSTL
jgi:hypothetical protein